MPTRPETKSDAAAMRILGADYWSRFDLWSARSWDAAEKAAAMAVEIGTVMDTNADLDPRIVTLFHAANTAKDFASMCNPIFAVSGMEHAKDSVTVGDVDEDLAMLLDIDEDS